MISTLGPLMLNPWSKVMLFLIVNLIIEMFVEWIIENWERWGFILLSMFILGFAHFELAGLGLGP